jgi:hypothetical protein
MIGIMKKVDILPNKKSEKAGFARISQIWDV